ncbi:MAG: HNH endonuclease [Chloroflexota bacterium]
MSRSYISRALRKQVRQLDNGRCAYCHTPTAITGAKLVIDHIVPESEGGQTILLNLCIACHACNQFKGSQTRAFDLLTGNWVPLFHPRQQKWRDHFRWSQDGSEMLGISEIGRGTIAALKMNHEEIALARRRWVAVGWHPPSEDL